MTSVCDPSGMDADFQRSGFAVGRGSVAATLSGMTVSLRIAFPLGCCAWGLAFLGATGSSRAADSLWVAARPGELALRSALRSDALALSCGDGQELSPNTPPRIGLDVSWKGLSLGGSLSVPGSTEPGHAVTTGFDLQLHEYARSLVADLFLQGYRGFYREGGDASTDLPDLEVYHAGLSLQYVANGERFSYRAAFDHSERQLRSAGSLLLGGGVHWTRIASDTFRIADSSTRVTDWQAGLDAGYAYNWVFSPGWLLHGSGSMGLHLGNRHLSGFLDRGLALDPAFLARLSASRSGRDWSFGTAFIANMLTLGDGQDAIGEQSARFELYLVRHFRLGS